MLKDQARLDQRNNMGVEGRRTMLSWYRRTGVGDVVQKDQTRQCRSIRVGSRMKRDQAGLCGKARLAVLKNQGRL
jgi:hypothetical protein